MIKSTTRCMEVIAHFILGITDLDTASKKHLDANDLALLETNGLVESELVTIRRHLQDCPECRKLAGEVLTRIQHDPGYCSESYSRHVG